MLLLGSTKPLCPDSMLRPILSFTFPVARVISFLLMESKPMTEKCFLSVNTKITS